MKMRPLSVIARTACDMYAWFMIIFGVVVIIHGDMTPGGGFQGGTVVATFLTLLLVTHGSEFTLHWFNDHIYHAFAYFGLLMFLFLGIGGFGWDLSRTLMYNFISVPDKLVATVQPFLPPSGTVSMMNLAVGIEVTGELSILVVIMFCAIRLFQVREDGTGKETGYDRR